MLRNTYLAKCVRNFIFVGDISREKANVVVSLYNIEYSNVGIPASKQSLDYVSAQETTAANNQVRIEFSHA